MRITLNYIGKISKLLTIIIIVFRQVFNSRCSQINTPMLERNKNGYIMVQKEKPNTNAQREKQNMTIVKDQEKPYTREISPL
jgi:hypothetical protein